MNKGNYEKKSKRIHKNNANHRRILSLYFNTEVNNENFNHYRFRYNRDVTKRMSLKWILYVGK